MHILGLILDNKYKPNLSSEYQNFAQARFQLANACEKYANYKKKYFCKKTAFV